MTDGKDADALPPATCTFTPDELDRIEYCIQGLEGCSRPVWGDADAPRCVWHADGADKLARRSTRGLLERITNSGRRTARTG